MVRHKRESESTVSKKSLPLDIENKKKILDFKRMLNLAKSWVPKNWTGTDLPPINVFKPLQLLASDSSRTTAGHIA